MIYADSVYRALTGREHGMMKDLVAMRELRHIRGMAASELKIIPSETLQLHRMVYDLVELPFLRDEWWLHYERMMPQMTGNATDIPEGPAKDILFGIVGKV